MVGPARSRRLPAPLLDEGDGRRRRHLPRPSADRHLQLVVASSSTATSICVALAEAVKRGVLQAGGFPLEFPVMSLGEALMKPTTMLYRNLMAMDVEESIRSYPLDGVVLLDGMRQDQPRASSWAPAQRRHPGHRRDRRADAQRPLARQGPRILHRTAGTTTRSCGPGGSTEPDFDEIENAMSRSHGHCMTMGTASTMACMTEASRLSPRVRPFTLRACDRAAGGSSSLSTTGSPPA